MHDTIVLSAETLIILGVFWHLASRSAELIHSGLSEPRTGGAKPPSGEEDQTPMDNHHDRLRVLRLHGGGRSTDWGLLRDMRHSPGETGSKARDHHGVPIELVGSPGGSQVRERLLDQGVQRPVPRSVPDGQHGQG